MMAGTEDAETRSADYFRAGPGKCLALTRVLSPPPDTQLAIVSRTLTPGQELSATLRPKDPKIDSEQILRIKDWRMIYWSI